MVFFTLLFHYVINTIIINQFNESPISFLILRSRHLNKYSIDLHRVVLPIESVGGILASVTIQMKATLMWCRSLWSTRWFYGLTIQMNDFEQHIPVVLFDSHNVSAGKVKFGVPCLVKMM